jgi:hypothetical protein
MPFVLPADPAAGNVAPASWGDAVRDGLNYLANPPACRVYNSATQAVADAVNLAPVLFNTEQYDTDSMHSTVTNTGRITFTTAGLYVVGAFVELAAAADYVTCLLDIRLAGATRICGITCGDSDDGMLLTCSTVYKFAAAEWIDIRVFQNNTAGAARNISSGIAGNGFWATWIGLG